jgi:hypothetical protein
MDTEACGCVQQSHALYFVPQRMGSCSSGTCNNQQQQWTQKHVVFFSRAMP